MLILIAFLATLPIPSCSFDFLDLLDVMLTASEEEEEEYTSAEEIEVDTSEEELEESVSYYDSDLVVHFLNVGQGDATFIELPNGETMLIDAGSDEYGGDVAMYIDALGYSTIDYVVATHPDEDHIGGMPEVLSLLSVGEVWAPDVDDTSQTYEDFLDAVDGAGLQIDTAVAGAEILVAEDLTIEVVLPNSDCSSDDADEWSAVIELVYGDTSFLFCGDASADDIYDWADGLHHVDVLKVARHGSYTGTDLALAKRLWPDVAIISYGEDNSYGYPHEEVLEALEDERVNVYGTAVNGTITVTSDGTGIGVERNQSGSVEAGGTSADETGGSTSTDSESSSTTTLEEEEKTVYITATGSKYHRRKSCTGLNNANEIYETTLSEAEAAGFEPCGICW